MKYIKYNFLSKSNIILIALFVTKLLSTDNCINAQSNKLFTINITAGSVIFDTIDLKSKSIHEVNTLNFKFDAFSLYDRVYDSKHSYYLLECDTAIIVMNTVGKLIKTIHKPGDVEGMTYDPINDKIYCALWKTNTFHFTELDIASGTFTLIRSLSDNNVHSATMDYESRYYYIISDTRGLLKINILTGIKLDSVKSFTTNNCRCNVFDYETGNIASTCVQNSQVILQLYNTANKSIKIIDTINKYGTGFFSYESAILDHNSGNWYLNLGKKLGIKNIRTNTKMDTMYLPFNRIRSLALNENTCYTPLVLSGLSKQNSLCFNASNGHIKTSLNGGRKPYSYSLNNTNYDTTSVFINLKSDNYTIYTKDKNNLCSLTVEVSLNEPEPLVIHSSIRHNSCYDDSSGQIKLNVKGATPPYAFSLKGNMYVEDSVFSNLGRGNYTFYIKDKNNCMDSLQNININAPPAFLLDSLKIKNINCNGEKNGEAEIHFSGGIEPYLISLDNKNYLTSQKMTGLGVGNYQIIAKDSHQCIAKSFFSINEPPLYKSTIFTVPSLCFEDQKGLVKVNITGGQPNDIYWFNIAGEQKIYSTKDTIHSLKSGVYQITIWNTNNCKDSLEFTIANPSKFNIKSTMDTTLCNGQLVKLELQNNHVKSYLLTSNTGLIYATDTITLSLAGTYYLEAKDSSNCTSNDTFTIRKLNMDITHDFLIPSVAFLSDTVYAVNISWPIADKTEWELNRASQNQFMKDQNTLGLHFNDTGKYALTLKSRFKSCGYTITKPLSIKSNSDSNKIDLKYGYSTPMIKVFKVYSNPHDGQNFKINILLRDTAAFSIYKIDPGTGYISGEMHFNNIKSHEFTGFTSSQSEVYYLKLIVGKESKVIKVVAIQ